MSGTPEGNPFDANSNLKQKNLKLVRNLVIVVILMFGFGFALVPLYDVLCKITGIN